MQRRTISLTFITPCFCGGADQTKSEVRVPSIRGELRWWFRCLGGDRSEEEAVFGGVAGSPLGSAVQFRVYDFRRGQTLYSPGFVAPIDAEAYLAYFLTAPNSNGVSRMWETPPDKETKRKGIARDSSQIPHQSSFELSIQMVRRLPRDLEERFHSCVDYFVKMGSIGYRKTRGFGAVANLASLPSRREFLDDFKSLAKHGFSRELPEGGGSKDPLIVLRQIENKLKGDKKSGAGLRLNREAEKHKTPLGYSHPDERQASALRFRPIALRTKAGDPSYYLLTFQAPDSVLSDKVLDNPLYSQNTRLI